MTLVHSCRKNKFVKGFCCWLYLGVERCRGRQSADGGSDEEVGSSKKKTKTLQKSIPYL